MKIYALSLQPGLIALFPLFTSLSVSHKHTHMQTKILNSIIKIHLFLYLLVIAQKLLKKAYVVITESFGEKFKLFSDYVISN